MKLGYYPGCSLEGSSVDYGISVEKMAEALGWQLEEVEDWNCCGATAVHQTNHLLALSLPARILALAEEQGITDLLAPCAACSHRLIQTNHELAEDKDLAKEVNETIEMDYKGSVRVFNLIQALQEHAGDLENRIVRRFDGLKIACYYGCLLLRQPKVLQFDDAEQPHSMEDIVAKLGAQPLDWPFRTECCGAGLTMSAKEAVVDLTHKVLENAAYHGAKAIVVACPMCHANLDMRQLDVNRRYSRYNIPILFLSQIVGLALGLSPKTLAINKHFIAASGIAEQLVSEE